MKKASRPLLVLIRDNDHYCRTLAPEYHFRTGANCKDDRTCELKDALTEKVVLLVLGITREASNSPRNNIIYRITKQMLHSFQERHHISPKPS